MPQPTPSSSEKLVALFRGSPVKASVLSGLVVLLAALWFRLLSGSHGPSAAAAAPIINGSRSTVATEFPAPRHSAAGSVSLETWAQAPIVPLERNLFSIPLDYYPRDGMPAAQAASANDGFWDRLAKSMSARADQQEQRQILIDNIRIAAGSVKLQSTILGPQPSAMINGELVREGGVVAGFRVLKIEPRQIIVQREGIRLAILMK